MQTNITGQEAHKKIIIVGPAYPYRGGIANFTDSLFQELKKNNSVNVITFLRQYPSILFPGKTQFEDFDDKKNYAQQLIDSINPFTWIKVGRLIKKERPDLLIIKFWLPFFGLCFGTIAGIAGKNKHTKIVSVCHNVIPHEKHAGDKFLTSFFFNKVDYFILLSNKIVDDLLSIKSRAKYAVLPHPVYSQFGESINKQEAKKHLQLNDEKIILFFGFIREYKGLDVLISALSFLKGKISVKLIVAGEFYSDKEKYENLIKALEVENSIYLQTDFIPSSEVKYYFSASDCVILPYRDATQSGIVQIAVNFKKPVIATNVGGLGEIIKDGITGYIVEKNNPVELADAITKFYNENKEAEFVSNLAEVASKYSWGSFVNGLLQLTEN